MSELIKGYDCQCCKKHHKYPLYVFAHYDEALIHKCDQCEATHEIFRGIAKMTAFPTATQGDKHD
jgi:hypothetical protein